MYECLYEFILRIVRLSLSDRVLRQLRLAWHSVELQMPSASPTSLEIQVRKKVSKLKGEVCILILVLLERQQKMG